MVRINRFLFLKLIVVISVMICFIASCNFNKNEKKETENTNTEIKQPEDTEKLPVTPQTNPKPLEEEKNAEAVEKNKEPQQKMQKEVPPKESSKENTNAVIPNKSSGETNTSTKASDKPLVLNPEEPSSATTNIMESLRPKSEALYWERLENIANSATDYFTYNDTRSVFISKNGKLYNLSKKLYIDIPFLCDTQGLNKSYRGLDSYVLFLSVNELSKYSGITIKAGDTDMTVFAATRHPSQNVYMLTSANGSGGNISEKDYKTLMQSYLQEHGTVRRLAPSTEEYNRILNFIRVYESRFDEYFVRNITTDDKYASVVLSSQSTSWDVKQFILVKDSTFWEVVLDSLENEPDVIGTVNERIPGFNLNILPSYNLYGKRMALKTNYNDILSLFLKDGVITSIDDVYYISGTEQYSYIVLNNHSRYICTNQGEGWKIKWIATYREAYEFLTEEGQADLAFILLDE